MFEKVAGDDGHFSISTSDLSNELSPGDCFCSFSIRRALIRVLSADGPCDLVVTDFGDNEVCDLFNHVHPYVIMSYASPRRIFSSSDSEILYDIQTQPHSIVFCHISVSF